MRITAATGARDYVSYAAADNSQHSIPEIEFEQNFEPAFQQRREETRNPDRPSLREMADHLAPLTSASRTDQPYVTGPNATVFNAPPAPPALAPGSEPPSLSEWRERSTGIVLVVSAHRKAGYVIYTHPNKVGLQATPLEQFLASCEPAGAIPNAIAEQLAPAAPQVTAPPSAPQLEAQAVGSFELWFETRVFTNFKELVALVLEINDQVANDTEDGSQLRLTDQAQGDLALCGIMRDGQRCLIIGSAGGRPVG